MFKTISMQTVKSSSHFLNSEFKTPGEGINYNNVPSPSGLVNNTQDADNLFVKVRWFLMLGRFIGIIPCQGAFQKDVHNFKYRIKSLAGFTTILMTGILLLGFILGGIGMCRAWKKNAYELAQAGADPYFYFIGLFTVSYFLRNGDEFANLFQKWCKMKFRLISKDTSLSKHAGIMVVILMTSAILENMVYTFHPIFDKNAETMKDGFLMTYYNRHHFYWHQLIPYHEVVAILAFVSNKVCIYTWNFLDLLIAIISRAIYMKFKMLYAVADCTFPKDSETGRRLLWGPNSQLVWSKLIQDHSTVCDIILEFQAFLSPLIFLTYSANIFFTCNQLLHQLRVNPRANEDLLWSIYLSWSIVHILIRAFVMSYMAAKVNTYAHKFSEILERCPQAFYSTEMERFERRLYLTQIGFNGLGCFTITKPLNLSIIGVILTLEVVLLQSLTL